MDDKGNETVGFEASTTSALQSLEMYMRLSAQSELEKRLGGIFEDSREMRVYELSNGLRSTRALADLTNYDKDRVSELWKKWSALGIAESSGAQKPYMAKFTLVELALIQKGDHK